MVAAGIGGNGAAVSRDVVNKEGASRLLENVGSKSRGGILGAELVERCVREVIWLIWLIDLLSGRARKVE